MKAPGTKFDRAGFNESTRPATELDGSTHPKQPVSQLHDISGIDDADALVIEDAPNTGMSEPTTSELTLREECEQLGPFSASATRLSAVDAEIWRVLKDVSPCDRSDQPVHSQGRKTALVLCAGTGSWVRALRNEGFTVVSIDLEVVAGFSPTAIIDITAWDFTVFPPGVFDVIVGSQGS